jgi:hypothetical protein
MQSTASSYAINPLVREGGLEPPCPHGHTDLNRARLPISPLARDRRRRVVNSARLARCAPQLHAPLLPTSDKGDHGKDDQDNSERNDRRNVEVVGFHKNHAIHGITGPVRLIHTSPRQRGAARTNIVRYASAATGRFLGLLDNFERGLERAVNGAFAKTFRSGLQPVEVTSALKRELDTKAVVVARDRILVPNKFTVLLSPADFSRMSEVGPSLIDEFVLQVEQHATVQRYSFAGGISIALKADEKLAEGVVNVDSASVKGAVVWTPVLEIDGTMHPLTSTRTIIGRGSDADITVDDTGISRKHVEILWDGKRGQAKDLGSTNGSKLNGVKLTKAPLEPDSIIEIGRTRIIFRVLAQSAEASAAEKGTAAK